MTQSTIRRAASAGVVAASLLIVGPNPAQAVADKHESGSHSENDDRSNRQDNVPVRGVSDFVDSVLNPGGPDNGAKPDLSPPLMDFGTGGSDLKHLAIMSSIAPEGSVALRSAAVADEPVGVNAAVADKPVGVNAAVADKPVGVSAAVADEPVGVNAAGAATRPGFGSSALSAAAARVPRVVIGNGRSPGVHDPINASARVREILRDDSLRTPVTLDAVPPAEPAAIEINIPSPPPLPPVERIGPAAPLVAELGTSTIDTVTDPLAGLAGLILIPAIGAALGYRQARGAQSLKASTRT